jgi:hypothetical protein
MHAFIHRLRLLIPVAAAAAVLALVAASSSANAAPSQYFGGTLCSGCSAWLQVWNLYVYNEAFNSWNPNGPLLRVMEHHPDGSWLYTYTGRGEIDICHPSSYTQPGCSNLASSEVSVTCNKETGAC